MKRNCHYYVRFVIYTDDIGNRNEIKETLEMLAENLGEKGGLDFDSREFKTNNRRKHLTFLEKCYEFLENDWICEVTVHSF